MEQEGTEAVEQQRVEGEQEKKMKVMVAVDESEGSLYALSWGLDHLFPPAAAVADSGEVVIVHVQQPFQNYVFPAGPGTVYATSSVMESVRKAQQQNAEALLAKITHLCSEKHTPVKLKSIVLEGDPKEMICQAVDQVHPDLLLIGSRGLGKLKRAFLGSVSDYCAHHAKCPILIVKPPPK